MTVVFSYIENPKKTVLKLNDSTFFVLMAILHLFMYEGYEYAWVAVSGREYRENIQPACIASTHIVLV